MQERLDKEVLRPEPHAYSEGQGLHRRAAVQVPAGPPATHHHRDTAPPLAQLIVKEFPATPSGQKAQEGLWGMGY